jgi:hypothetical protein
MLGAWMAAASDGFETCGMLKQVNLDSRRTTKQYFEQNSSVKPFECTVRTRFSRSTPMLPWSWQWPSILGDVSFQEG